MVRTGEIKAFEAENGAIDQGEQIDVEGQNAIPGKEGGETKMMWATKSSETRLTNLDNRNQNLGNVSFFPTEKQQKQHKGNCF